jgi:hypothetical protein
MSMLNGDAECPSCKFMLHAVLGVQAGPCCMSILHICTACPHSMAMLLVLSVCPCRMPMLHEHIAWTCYTTCCMNMSKKMNIKIKINMDIDTDTGTDTLMGNASDIDTEMDTDTKPDTVSIVASTLDYMFALLLNFSSLWKKVICF